MSESEPGSGSLNEIGSGLVGLSLSLADSFDDLAHAAAAVGAAMTSAASAIENLMLLGEGGAMWQRIENTTGNHNKFWEGRVAVQADATFVVETRWGRIDHEGNGREQAKSYSFDSRSRAQEFLRQKLITKLGEGYVASRTRVTVNPFSSQWHPSPPFTLPPAVPPPVAVRRRRPEPSRAPEPAPSQHDPLATPARRFGR